LLKKNFFLIYFFLITFQGCLLDSFKSSRGVGVEIVERDNYITQGCFLDSFKSLRGVGVEIVERDNIS
jgi:hypothetical protein